MTDEDFMSVAIDISAKAKYPFGAIVVKDGEIIGRSDAEVTVSKSWLRHDELVALEDASKGGLYGALEGAIMYCSCEREGWDE